MSKFKVGDRVHIDESLGDADDICPFTGVGKLLSYTDGFRGRLWDVEIEWLTDITNEPAAEVGSTYSVFEFEIAEILAEATLVEISKQDAAAGKVYTREELLLEVVADD